LIIQTGLSIEGPELDHILRICQTIVIDGIILSRFSVFTASDLPQLTMSPVPVVGSNGSVSLGNPGIMQGVSNMGQQAIAIDPNQGEFSAHILI
jgi:hypothetical protein